MEDNKETVGVPKVRRPTVFNRIKGGLAMASQLIIASPLKLPPKVVAVARYMALALGILDAVTAANQKGEDDDESE